MAVGTTYAKVCRILRTVTRVILYRKNKAQKKRSVGNGKERMIIGECITEDIYKRQQGAVCWLGVRAGQSSRSGEERSLT